MAYEDACKICAREQENAGLHVLTDGVQYYDWEAPGYQLEPIFHYITGEPRRVRAVRPAR